MPEKVRELSDGQRGELKRLEPAQLAAVMWWLSSYATSDMVPLFLWGTLQRRSEEARALAVSALSFIRSPELAPLAIDSLERAKSSEDRLRLTYVLSWSDDLRAVPVLLRLLEDETESAFVRGQAAEGLGDLLEFRRGALVRRTKAALTRALDCRAAPVRFYSAFSLAKLRHKPALRKLRELAAEKGGPVVGGLWTVAEEVEDAIAFLEGRTPPERVAQSSSSARPLPEPSAEICAEARAAGLPPRQVEALHTMSASQLAAAVRWLGYFPSKQVVPLFVHLLSTPRAPAVHAAASQALANSRQEFVPTLLRPFDLAHSTDHRFALAYALSNSHDRRAIPMLLQLLLDEREPPSVRGMAAEGAADLAPGRGPLRERVKDALQRCLNDPESEVRQEAQIALALLRVRATRGAARQRARDALDALLAARASGAARS